MRTHHTFSRVAALIAVALLTACGGGSDTPADANAPAPAPMPAPQAPAPAPTSNFTLGLSTDKALVIQGLSTSVTVTVARAAGFEGAVSVVLTGLPAGVSASPVIIGSGAVSAPITLTAQPSAPHSLPTAASATGTGSDTQTASSPLTVTVGGLPGSVDTSFNGGPQLTSVGEGEDYAFAMAVQPDGKVITVGRTSTATGGYDIAITRHLRDGTLDPDFGSAGKVVTAIAPGRGADDARAVLVEPDGRIVVAGYSDASGTDMDFMVVRYNADGTLDPTFGDAGKTVTNIGDGTDIVFALARQPDGKIVAAGSAAFSQSTAQDFALIRYNTDGSLDAGFGVGGKVTTAINTFGSNELIYAIVLQPVGDETRIVAVGGEGTFIAARYTASGLLDASFGEGGKIRALFQSNIGSAESVTLTADNKIVIAGHIGHEFSLVQLNTDGTLDTGFGSGGKVVTPVSSTNWDEATAVVRQADGKLLVGGWVYEGVSTNGNFVVLRYNADGTSDAGFGTAGQVITPVAPNAARDSGRALALQVDERVSTVRLLQAGEATDGSYKFALVRYWL
jgi:uncharacterized delta-60 repeat protein